MTDKVKVIVHDYTEGKDVWFGPFQSLEILETTIWAMDASGRKEELAFKSPDGFWIVHTEGDDPKYATGKCIKVSVDAKIKAATSMHTAEEWESIAGDLVNANDALSAENKRLCARLEACEEDQ